VPIPDGNSYGGDQTKEESSLLASWSLQRSHKNHEAPTRAKEENVVREGGDSELPIHLDHAESC